MLSLLLMTVSGCVHGTQVWCQFSNGTCESSICRCSWNDIMLPSAVYHVDWDDCVRFSFF